MARLEHLHPAMRASLLAVVRFDPPSSVYLQVERALETCTDELPLTRLLAAAARAESVTAFQTMLEQELRSSTPE